MGDQADGRVVDLRARLQAQADPAAIARDQVRHAREEAGASEADFAVELSATVGWEVSPELVSCWETDITPPGDIITALPLITGRNQNDGGAPAQRPLAGIEAAYVTRADFVAASALDQLFDDATEILAAGLSHNLICQQYPNDKLVAKLNDGGTAEVLFLRAGGEAIAQREEEEGYEIGGLSGLTTFNLSVLTTQIRPKLVPSAASNLMIGTYDEVIRFNLMFFDRQVCVLQPYLHGVRGIETPAIVATRQPTPGIYDTMWACYEWLRGRARFQ